MIQLENYNGDTNYNLLEDDDIVNTLTSTATNKALSANQGKSLKDTLDNFFEYNENKEIDTGLKWFNGKPIYRKFFKIDLSNASLKGTKDFDATQCDFVFIDECSCLWSSQDRSGSNFYFYPVNKIGSVTNEATALDIVYGSVMCDVSKNKINVALGPGFARWYNIFYVVLLYVKKG